MEEEKDVAGFRFFRVLLHDFSSKLLLPHDFIKKINGRRREVATLMSPNGKMWDVDCHKEIKEVYFGGTSWQDFIRANKLGIGFFLVFHYKGNMVFSFRAFDLSTREITYEPVTRNCKRKMEKVIGDHVVDLDSQSVGESGEATSNKKGKGKEQSEDPPMKIHFEVKVQSLTPRRCCMKIPDKISSSCGLMKMHIDKITIEDQKGRKWIIGLLLFNQTHTIYLSKGWKEFANANELNVGDKCIFDLLSQSKKDQLIFKVQIIKKSTPIVTPIYPSKIIEKNTPIVTPVQPSKIIKKNTPIVTPIKHPNKLKSSDNPNISYSSIQVMIKPRNLRRNLMYIPVRFVEHNGLSGCSKLCLKNSHGQMWLASVVDSREDRKAFYMKGWLEFARSNKLEVGDVCTFEITSKDEGNVVHVHVEKNN